MVFRGEVLRAARARAGLSAGELAQMVGAADGSAVRAWERGRVGPTPRRIPLLARAVGVEPIELVTADEGPVTLGALRRAAGLTVKELAARTQMSLARWHGIEHGEGILRPSEVQIIATALGVRVEDVEDARLAGASDDQAGD